MMTFTHLTRYPPVVGTALPEPAGEAFYVTDYFFLVREIHFPYERAVAENPHDATLKLNRYRGGERGRLDGNLRAL